MSNKGTTTNALKKLVKLTYKCVIEPKSGEKSETKMSGTYDGSYWKPVDLSYAIEWQTVYGLWTLQTMPIIAEGVRLNTSDTSGAKYYKTLGNEYILEGKTSSGSDFTFTWNSDGLLTQYLEVSSSSKKTETYSFK